MMPFRSISLSLVLAAALSATGALHSEEGSKPSALSEKLQPYIECINRLSQRAHASEARYKSWAAESGPTGKERVIYGVYTIYDPSACAAAVEKAAAMEPKDEALEKSGTAYIAAVKALDLVLKEADNYYAAGDYKDDHMAKGKTLHPKLMAAWQAFDKTDAALRKEVEIRNDQVQLEELAEVEKKEGKQAHYYVLNLMIKAKAVVRTELGDEKPDLSKITEVLSAYEAAIQDIDQYDSANPKQIGSLFKSNAKKFLKSGKEYMRRIRDKKPYTSGEKMMLSQQGAGWMVEGSPASVNRDYNDLVDSFNRGSGI
jgi:hypothetical protein